VLITNLIALKQGLDLTSPLKVENKVIPLHTCHFAFLSQLVHEKVWMLVNQVKGASVRLKQNLEHESDLRFAKITNVQRLDVWSLSDKTLVRSKQVCCVLLTTLVLVQVFNV